MASAMGRAAMQQGGIWVHDAHTINAWVSSTDAPGTKARLQLLGQTAFLRLSLPIAPAIPDKTSEKSSQDQRIRGQIER